MGVEENDASFVHQRPYSSKHRVISTITDIGVGEMRKDALSAMRNSSLRWCETVKESRHHFDLFIMLSGVFSTITVSDSLDENISTITHKYGTNIPSNPLSKWGYCIPLCRNLCVLPLAVTSIYRQRVLLSLSWNDRYTTWLQRRGEENVVFFYGSTRKLESLAWRAWS